MHGIDYSSSCLCNFSPLNELCVRYTVYFVFQSVKGKQVTE